MKRDGAVRWTAIIAAMGIGAGARAGDLGQLQKTMRADLGTGTRLGCMYDAGCSGGEAGAVAAAQAGTGTPAAGLAPAGPEPARAEIPAPPPPPPQAAGGRETGAWAGIKKGASEGALLGFYAVISPAASLLSEGVGRDMSRAYDGPDAGNGDSWAYKAAGVALAVILYVPALIAGGLGGAAGAVAGAASEAVSPGSTRGWDTEKALFQR